MPGAGRNAGERKRLATEDRRAQLLEVGLELYAARGFAEVPIDEIAAAAGVSKGLLYHYFESKRGFFLAVLDHAAALVLTALEPDPTLSPAGQALAGIRAFVDTVSERSDVYLALMGSGRGDPEVATRVERVRRAVLRLVVERIGVDERRPAIRTALWSWIAGVEAGVTDWLDARELAPEDLVALFAQQLRASLRAAVALDPDCGLDLEAHPGLRPE